jgi:nitrate reductase gamma subunit
MLLTVTYSILLYVAAAVFIGGLAYRLFLYARTPAPLKIPTTPAPLSRRGVALRLAREVTLFESLFKSNKWTWLFGWVFHAALLVVVLRHLRYFIEPVWGWVALVQPFGIYAGFAMVAALGLLWARRLFVPRVRYISRPSDYLHLLLLIAIGASGLLMKFVAHIDIIGLKAFVLGLLRFDWQPMPTDPILLIHLGLVALLMIIFPMSKLLHGAGVFFSPTRNQADDARERRHLAPWAAKLES